MSALFEALTLREVTVPNRIWVSPMCMYSAAAEGADVSAPTDFHLTHLASRAAGGAGLVMAEATAVRPDGRISPSDLGLWNDRQRDAFSRITAAITAHGAVPAIQLAHAGRKASTSEPWNGGAPLPQDRGGWQVVGPTEEPFSAGDPVPHQLTEQEIQELVRDFAAAAERALAAGFQAIEIHGAHGYLLNSFLSPAVNQRTDHYGGSFENRLRFPLEVVDAVRAVWPSELPLLFRASATDWLVEDPDAPREGWSGEDTVRLGKELQAHGVDLLDNSTGGMVKDATVPAAPGFQVPFASRVRNEAGLHAGAVGVITEPQQAEDIISTGQADAVLLGRALLRDPYWAHHAAQELDVDSRWPRQYGYAVGSRR